MYMPLMVDIKRVVIFGGERGEGLQKTEKLSVYADELLVVPERPYEPEYIELASGRLPHVGEELLLDRARRVPVAREAAAPDNIARFLVGASFVVSDLAERSLNELISAACRERGLLCNVIDTKELCSVWFMSLIETPHLLAGLSSKGSCAYYAKAMRIELEEEFRSREPVAALLTEIRERIPERLDRKELLHAIYTDPEFTLLRKGREWGRARRRAETLLFELAGAER